MRDRFVHGWSSRSRAHSGQVHHPSASSVQPSRRAAAVSKNWTQRHSQQYTTEILTMRPLFLIHNTVRADPPRAGGWDRSEDPTEFVRGELRALEIRRKERLVVVACSTTNVKLLRKCARTHGDVSRVGRRSRYRHSYSPFCIQVGLPYQRLDSLYIARFVWFIPGWKTLGVFEHLRQPPSIPRSGFRLWHRGISHS